MKRDEFAEVGSRGKPPGVGGGAWCVETFANSGWRLHPATAERLLRTAPPVRGGPESGVACAYRRVCAAYGSVGLRERPTALMWSRGAGLLHFVRNDVVGGYFGMTSWGIFRNDVVGDISE